MTLLTATRISKKFSDQVILQDVSFTINTGNRIGLVGKNGSGKTTLFEMMSGRSEPDDGNVTQSKQCVIDYIEQEVAPYLEQTLMEYVMGARPDLGLLRRQIQELEENLSVNPEESSSLQRLGFLQIQFEQDGGFSFENEVKTILTGLGFEKDRFTQRLRNFSGGERNRAGLARALAGIGNLLLLDEPTNHLDIESTIWLEDHLRQTDRTYLVVSHDRAFLEKTVDLVWEINFGKIETYVGSFDKYLVERAERRRLHEHRYRHQQEEIKRLEEYVRRNMAGQKTKQAQSKMKYLGRIKRLPPPRGEGKGPAIKVRSSGRSYAHVMSMDDVSIGYGERLVVSNINCDVYRGDMVGIVGRNGCGKSTMLKALIGELVPSKGEIKLGANVDIAYFDQELSDLQPNLTVLDSLWEVDPMTEMGTIRSFLGRFGFTGDDCLKKIVALSGGEKTKLSLARLLYHPANLIIFDEPTNHLDIDAREALEEALLDYEGSCIIVSHDRYFLDRVVDRIIHIDDGAARTYTGNYSYFQSKLTPDVKPSKIKDPAQKAAYMEFKQKSRERSRHKKKIESTRSEIVELEAALVKVEARLSEGIAPDDWEQLHDMTETKKETEEKILTLYATLEELERVEVD